MEWGVKYEPIAISILENILNIKIKEVGLLIHDNLTWLGASPDGLTNSNILVEIKCVYNRKIDNNVQTIYWIQMQIQMEVCNIDECYIFQGKFIETNKDIYDNCTDKYKGIDNNYWILDSYMYKIIKRDKKWFKNVKDELYQFWREVYFTKNINLTNKRILEDINSNSNKKTRTSKIYNSINKYINNNWIPATAILNYMMDDPLIDWLNMYGNKNNIIQDNINNNYNFNNYIKQKGILFENDIIINITNRFPDNFIDIDKYYNKEAKTIESMKNGIPFIYHGLIRNNDNYTFGIPDI